MSSQTNKKVTLKGQDAIDLWQKGLEEWNQYVEDNPESDIDFSKCDFTNFNDVSFEEYMFPNGKVNFNFTKFGNGDVSFNDANFGDGDVSFVGAKFGDGYVGFHNANFGVGDVVFKVAKFGDGNVIFTGAKFGDGNVSFYDANFGDGNVDFDRAKFGDGNVEFRGAEFGDGDVSFIGAKFGNGHTVFSRTKFGDGDVEFGLAKFGDGVVNFTGAKFGGGDVGFNAVKFGEGNVLFNQAEFGEGDVAFGYAIIEGAFIIKNLKNCSLIKSLNFNFSTFNGPVNIEDNEFNCIPDFTNTKLTNQLNLEHFQTTPNKKNHSNLLIPVFVFFYKALWGQSLKFSYKKRAIKLARKFTIFNKTIISDKKDISRIRRLKELAETNKHHKLALDLHVEEIKSSRWIETTSKRTLFAEYLFQVFGDFGRSLQRPFLGLISTWVAFTPVYFYASNMGGESFKKLSDSAVFSFAQMLPLAPISRDAKKETLKSLYNDDMPNWIIGIAGFQSLISIALVFLIGLALRNRFRI